MDPTSIEQQQVPLGLGVGGSMHHQGEDVGHHQRLGGVHHREMGVLYYCKDYALLSTGCAFVDIQYCTFCWWLGNEQ